MNAPPAQPTMPQMVGQAPQVQYIVGQPQMMYPAQPQVQMMGYPQHYQQTIYSSQPTIIIQPQPGLPQPMPQYYVQQPMPVMQSAPTQPMRVHHNMIAQPSGAVAPAKQ
jgi:hypothetical protein